MSDWLSLELSLLTPWSCDTSLNRGALYIGSTMIFVLPQWCDYSLESLTWEHWEKWSISYRHAFTRCCRPLSQPCNFLVRRFMMGDVPSVIASIWINSCPYLLSWSAKILEGKATSQSWVISSFLSVSFVGVLWIEHLENKTSYSKQANLS